MHALLGRLVGAGVADALFPTACALCGAADVDPRRSLCEDCAKRVEDAARLAFCRRCGTTLGPFAGTPAGCPACRATRVPLAGITRFGEFSGDLAELVRSFKFRGADYLDRLLGEMVGSRILAADWAGEIDALTVVPTCWMHRLRRRFHAASAIASHAARQARIPLLGMLRRVQGGLHQVGLPKAERLENVKGKFQPARGIQLNGATVCLIDDVVTTGATLYECAKALRRGGASKVYAAVLAHAGGLPSTPRDA